MDEDEELPEDRFHKDDPMSNHYIQQREGDKAEKHKRHADEKAERESKKEKVNIYLILFNFNFNKHFKYRVR